MLKLLPFELGKLWKKKSFLLMSVLLIVLNLFFMWYINDSNGDDPPLSAYKAIAADLSSLDNKGKQEYLENMRADLDGLSLVEMILSVNFSGIANAEERIQKLIEDNKEIYDKYKDIYAEGKYLKYTSSIDREIDLINEVYEECVKVCGYDDYIKSIEDNKNKLSGISIFSKNEDKDSFSSRNIEKSYADHKNLTSENISFYPSKGTKIAVNNIITDLLLLLWIFLFTGGLITEEKEKGLFYVTRSTKNGVAHTIGAKLLAMLIHSFACVILMVGSNYIYSGFTAGLCDFSANIQSLAIFTESSLNITFGEYILLEIIIKSLVLFGLGAFLTAISIITSKNFVPQLCGVGWLGLNFLCFKLIPPYSLLNPFKYLSFWGMISSKSLLGEYLNFNIFGYPIRRLTMAIIVLAVGIGIFTALNFLLFIKGKSLELHKKQIPELIPFKPYKSLFRHEGFKLLFMNKGIIVLLLFGFILCRGDLQRQYYLSPGEKYYCSIIQNAEGKLTDEKEAFILEEKERYEKAFLEIEAIDQLAASGEIDDFTAHNMKSGWESQTVFYPYFQRAEAQYDHVKETDGEFVYDTGWYVLLGKSDNSFLTDYMLISICIIFAFCGVFQTETQKGAWDLISATAKGKKAVIKNKALVCTVCSVLIAVLPRFFHFAAISRTLPMGMASASAANLPMFYQSGINLPIWLLIGIAILAQIFSVLIILALVLFISFKSKNYFAALLLSFLLFAVPSVLAVMGLDFAQWFSFYPIYSFTARI